MGQILIRCGVLLSVLMFGFILGIIYSDSNQATDEREHLYDIKEEIGEDESKPRFIIKDSDSTVGDEQSNIIEVEDEDGVVVYEEGGSDLHDTLEDHIPAYVEKNDTPNNSEVNALFSDLGTRTADVFEHVFQGLFSVIDGQ